MPRPPSNEIVGSIFGCFVVEDRLPRKNTTSYFQVRCLSCNTRSERAHSYLLYARTKNWTNCTACKTNSFRPRQFIHFGSYLREVPHLDFDKLMAALTLEEAQMVRTGEAKAFAGDTDILRSVIIVPTETKAEPEVIPTEPLRQPAWRVTHRAWTIYFSDPDGFERRSDASALWKQLEETLAPDLIAYMLSSAEDSTTIVWTSSPAPDSMLWVYPTKIR